MDGKQYLDNICPEGVPGNEVFVDGCHLRPTGMYAVARAFFDQVRHDVVPTKKAMCFIHLGELDSAFHYLEKGRLEKDINAIFIQMEPNFDIIRQDPRFISFTDKIGLWE